MIKQEKGWSFQPTYAWLVKGGLTMVQYILTHALLLSAMTIGCFNSFLVTEAQASLKIVAYDDSYYVLEDRQKHVNLRAWTNKKRHHGWMQHGWYLDAGQSHWRGARRSHERELVQGCSQMPQWSRWLWVPIRRWSKAAYVRDQYSTNHQPSWTVRIGPLGQRRWITFRSNNKVVGSTEPAADMPSTSLVWLQSISKYTDPKYRWINRNRPCPRY